MKDLLFVLRAFILTVIAILILQIKVGGEETLEQRSEAWIRGSGLVDHLQDVADGAVVVIYRAYDKIGAFIDEKLAGTPLASAQTDDQKLDQPGERHKNFRLERSKEFIKEKAGQAKDILEEKVETFQDQYLEEELPLEEE